MTVGRCSASRRYVGAGVHTRDMSSRVASPCCGAAGGRRHLASVYAAGIRTARTRTTMLAPRVLVVRGRSVTTSTTGLADLLRPPVQPRSPRRPVVLAWICGGLLCLLAYGAVAGPAADRAACALMMGLVGLVGAPAAVLALARLSSRRSGTLAGRAWQVWQAGSWCGQCGQATLPVPWAGREVVVPAAAVHHAVAEIAAGRLPALAGYR